MCARQGGSDCIVIHQNGSPPALFVCFTDQTSAFCWDRRSQTFSSKILFMLHHRSQYSSFLVTEKKKNATANTKANVLCLSVPENTGITQAYNLYPVLQKDGLSLYSFQMQKKKSERIVNTLRKKFQWGSI